MNKRYVAPASLLCTIFSMHGMVSRFSEQQKNYSYIRPAVLYNGVMTLGQGLLATTILTKGRHPFCLVPGSLAYLNYKTTQLFTQKEITFHNKDVMRSANMVAGLALMANSILIMPRAVAWTVCFVGSGHLYNAYNIHKLPHSVETSEQS